MLMHDMPRAVARIRQAIQAQEPILVYGDYDVDGTAATAILVRTLRKLGADPAWFIPSRFTDGYGLHTNIVQAAAEQGVKLLITVDTGITAVEAGEAAKALGVDLIVTDHHHISTVPDAVALVHPAYPRSMYSFHDLCGAGVVFKLAQALLGEFPEDLLDLVALATVADQVPLVGENRVLVKEGLKRLNSEPNLGLEALIAVAGLAEKRVTSTAAAFQLAPRINAVGRLAHAKRAVELFLTEDPQEALSIARELNVYNDRRKALQSQVEAEALAQIEAHPKWLGKKGWWWREAAGTRA
ncbi:hypothetical protein D2Q93_04415 [Alicyclobacillaceae bacterium I2511]|nr:hypothetical protein D2Q93_04415 [Alicyclobacillaceae bacterium I2511]